MVKKIKKAKVSKKIEKPKNLGMKMIETPEGVKILSFVFFVGALVSLYYGVAMLFYSDLIRTSYDIALLALEMGLDSSVSVFAGIVLLVLGIVQYYVGRDLLRGKKWAKIIVAVLAVLALIYAIAGLFSGMYASGVFMILLSGVVAWYIIFCKRVKPFFVD